MTGLHKRLFLLLSYVLLASCGGGGGSGPGVGTLSISLTDAPVDNAQAVVIFFTAATIQAADGSRTVVQVTDPVTQQAGRSIDLLQYAGNTSVVLFNQSLTAQNYSWIRLDVDFDPQKTYIQIAGNRYPLTCTSCENNGVKLNRSFSVTADATQAFVLDFDLRKSITDPQSTNNYKLRPTVRVVDTIAAGNIAGTVDGTLIAQLGGVTGCSVYVYGGQVSSPDDVYIPDTGNVPTGYNNPVTTATVTYDSQTSTYKYMAGYLPAGTYTASLTCDAELDDPMLDDSNVSFTHTTQVTVIPGATTTLNFNPLVSQP